MKYNPNQQLINDQSDRGRPIINHKLEEVSRTEQRRTLTALTE